MLKVDIKLIKSIANLSKIDISDKEIKEIAPQLQTILDSVETLKGVKTDNVVPTSLLKIKFSELREDKVDQSLSTEDALKNAPFSEDGFVKVFGTTFGDLEES